MKKFLEGDGKPGYWGEFFFCAFFTGIVCTVVQDALAVTFPWWGEGLICVVMYVLFLDQRKRHHGNPSSSS